MAESRVVLILPPIVVDSIMPAHVDMTVGREAIEMEVSGNEVVVETGRDDIVVIVEDD